MAAVITAVSSVPSGLCGGLANRREITFPRTFYRRMGNRRENPFPPHVVRADAPPPGIRTCGGLNRRRCNFQPPGMPCFSFLCLVEIEYNYEFQQKVHTTNN